MRFGRVWTRRGVQSGAGESQVEMPRQRESHRQADAIRAANFALRDAESITEEGKKQIRDFVR